MGRNFDDYPGFQPFRSWGNTYAQEFYELTLMDENKPNAIKASEAIEMASRWEVGQGPFGKPMGPAGGLNNDTGPDALAMAAAAAAVAQAKKDVCISVHL